MKAITIMILVLLIDVPNFAQEIFVSKPRPSFVHLQKDSLTDQPGKAVYAELGGKGIYSLNVDFPINSHHRYSVGITQLDYDIAEHEDFRLTPLGALTAGAMYYYLYGSDRAFLELGAGVSVYHRLDLDLHNDSHVSLHGVIGYRYQKKDGLIFRAGFTPFVRTNGLFLPLIGVSVGYSW